MGAEVVFDAQVFLLTKARAKMLLQQPVSAAAKPTSESERTPATPVTTAQNGGRVLETGLAPLSAVAGRVLIRLVGTVNPEVWNRIGIKLLPKLRGGQQLRLGIDFCCEVEPGDAASLKGEIEQALADLHLAECVRVDVDDRA